MLLVGTLRLQAVGTPGVEVGPQGSSTGWGVFSSCP